MFSKCMWSGCCMTDFSYKISIKPTRMPLLSNSDPFPPQEQEIHSTALYTFKIRNAITEKSWLSVRKNPVKLYHVLRGQGVRKLRRAVTGNKRVYVVWRGRDCRT